MILDFEPRTLANMEVALDRACANIPGAEKHRTRRHIADRIIRCARKGNRSLVALSQAALIAAAELRKRRTAKDEARSVESGPASVVLPTDPTASPSCSPSSSTSAAP
jgi:hypothetical protein